MNAVNDNPVNTVPGDSGGGRGDAARVLGANGNAISVSDVDAGGATSRWTLDTRVDGVAKGTINLPQTAGLTFTSGDGTERREHDDTGGRSRTSTRRWTGDDVHAAAEPPQRGAA